jgi:hypothetical protein
MDVVHLTGRAWPVTLGAGFGLGSAYTECQSIFRPPQTFYRPVSDDARRQD